MQSLRDFRKGKTRGLRIKHYTLPSFPSSLIDGKQAERIGEKLRTLHINDNVLEEFSESFGDWGFLTYISAAHNLFVSFPDIFGLGKFSVLKSLNLSYNQISSFPSSSFCCLSSLSSLDLSWNKISSLPCEIGNLSELTSLSLCGNFLEVLPDELCLLGKMKELDVSFNLLNRLPGFLFIYLFFLFPLLSPKSLLLPQISKIFFLFHQRGNWANDRHLFTEFIFEFVEKFA